MSGGCGDLKGTRVVSLWILGQQRRAGLPFFSPLILPSKDTVLQKRRLKKERRMAVGLCKAMSQVSWCFHFVSRNSTSFFGTLGPQRVRNSPMSTLTTSLSLNYFKWSLYKSFTIFFSQCCAQICDGKELSSLDGSWLVLEISASEIKDRGVIIECPIK